MASSSKRNIRARNVSNSKFHWNLLYCSCRNSTTNLKLKVSLKNCKRLAQLWNYKLGNTKSYHQHSISVKKIKLFVWNVVYTL